MNALIISAQHTSSSYNQCARRVSTEDNHINNKVLGVDQMVRMTICLNLEEMSGASKLVTLVMSKLICILGNNSKNNDAEFFWWELCYV